MSSDYESDPRVTAVESLPRPGAVRLWERDWIPTLDGEPIEVGYPFNPFLSREEALAEAIKRVKRRAGLAFEVTIGSRAGCCVDGEFPVIVETVAEARKFIGGYARRYSGSDARSRERPGNLLFKTRRGRPAWKSLLECETHRRYDPKHPEAGMTCSYLLYWHGPKAGGYAEEIWVTGPPELWDHPADQPASEGSVIDLD